LLDHDAILLGFQILYQKNENDIAAARIREILENLGLAQESLPSNVVTSAQVLANVANLLNIRDTEMSRCVLFAFTIIVLLWFLHQYLKFEY